MARPLRLEYPGSLWHVTARGNEQRPIVMDDPDRRRILALLGECVTRFGWILYSYALMSNHFHLQLELTRPTLSRGMQWLNGKYAQHFNRRHDRSGHLFQGRFGAFLIEKETYFLEVLRYVVLNPVRAGRASHPEDDPWTSYLATAGYVAAPDWLAVDRVQMNFSDDTTIARDRYRNFVLDGIGAARPWKDLVGQIYLGREEWVAEINEMLESAPRSDEFPRPQRDPEALTMFDIISAVSKAMEISEDAIRRGRGGAGRMLCTWIATRDGQIRLREIAASLRVRSTGHVTNLVKRCDKLLDRDPFLRSCADRSLELLARYPVAGGRQKQEAKL